MLRAKIAKISALAALIVLGPMGLAGVKVQVVPRDNYPNDGYYNDRGTDDNDGYYYDRDGGREGLREHQREEREELREHQRGERERARDDYEDRDYHDDGGLNFDFGK